MGRFRSLGGAPDPMSTTIGTTVCPATGSAAGKFMGGTDPYFGGTRQPMGVTGICSDRAKTG